MNDEPFENYCFLDPSFCSESAKAKILSASIRLNNKVIFKGAKDWQPASVQQAIWNQIGEKEPLISLKVWGLSDTETSTVNELFGLLLQQENIPQEGLKELMLDGGDEHMSEPLDSSVMQSLLSKCKALTKLQMTEMRWLPENVRIHLSK